MVRRCGSFLNPGPTFSIYVCHLAKACQITGFNSSVWLDSEVQASIGGLSMRKTFRVVSIILFYATFGLRSLSWDRSKLNLANYVISGLFLSLGYSPMLTHRLGHLSMMIFSVDLPCATRF